MKRRWPMAGCLRLDRCVVRRWPWAVIGFWMALAAVLSVTFPPLTEMAAKRPVPILPSDAPVLQTTKQISEAYHQSGSETRTSCWSS